MKTIIHPSIIYPREVKMKTEAVKEICPACRSSSIRTISPSPELVFKRQSTCTNCGTVWGTRTAPTQLRYKQQQFYR